jgi:probable F420-dependent oxidoreductase
MLTFLNRSKEFAYMAGSTLGMGQLGVWTNQFDQVGIAEVRAAAREIEELGYSTLWVGELFGREAVAQASLLLETTSRMMIATGIANVYVRDPATMAQAQRTLLEAHGGRFVLGLGISHPWFVEQIRGLRFGPRVPTMRAYLDKMDAAPFGPPGAEKRGPRVLGAIGPKMLALAAERTEGALPFGVPL